MIQTLSFPFFSSHKLKFKPAAIMDCRKAMLVASDNQQKVPQVDQRRSANYKPNIWKYDLLQSLTSQYVQEEHRRQVEELKEKVVCMFVDAVALAPKLELIDTVEKLGLAYHFEGEIEEALDTMVAVKKEHYPNAEEDLYVTALFFRLLRQHSFNVSQDMFRGFMSEMGTLIKSTDFGTKAVLELREASHLALEGENILAEAKAFTTGILKNISSNDNNKVAKQLARALELPLHWRVQWYDVKRHIHELENKGTNYSVLVKLAKLNFNMVQAAHQKDLKNLSRWWTNLGLSDDLSFARNRLVESYLCAVGTAYEPRHESFRIWLTKAIVFILVIDDIYDVYGSLEELQCFTNAVERWDDKEIEHLPECMKICFQALYNSTNQVAYETEQEKGWNSVLPHLQKVWAGFCKALLAEAKWYNTGFTPSLDEYLDNGWISSSGPILSLHAFFSTMEETGGDVIDLLPNTDDLVRCTSLIIRLCNDLATSTAEIERGDAPSSITCYMHEANVSEEIARKHIGCIITDAWMKINNGLISMSPLLQPFVKYVTNTARVAHSLYQNGDGFGVQDRETRAHILSLLIEPLMLD